MDKQRERVTIGQDLVGDLDIVYSIVDSAQVCLAYLDREFRFLHVNDNYTRSSGHTREELLGRNHFDLFPNAENQAIFQRVRDTGERVQFRARPFEYADQPERGVTYWDWTLMPVMDGTGAVRCLAFSLMDVTAHVREADARAKSENLAEELAVSREKLRRQNAELRKAQNELEIERKRYRDLFDRAPDGYLLTDLDGVIQEANQAAGRLLNVEPEALAGKPLAVYVPETEHLVFLAALQRLRDPRQERELRLEMRLLARGERAFDADCTVVVNQGANSDHRVPCVRWLIRDVTERKQSERERERLLAKIDRQRRLNQAVADHGSVSIVVLGANDFYVRSANQASLELLDEPLRSQGVTGMHIGDVLPGIGKQGAIEAFHQVASTGEPLNGTGFAYEGLKRGTTYWDWSLQLLPPETAVAEPALLLLAYEVTDIVVARRQAEEEAARLDATFAAAATGLICYDLDGRITRINAAAQALLAFSPEERSQPIQSRLHRPFTFVDGDRQPLPVEEWPVMRALRGEAVHSLTAGVEATGSASWDMHWVSISAAPVRDEDGSLTGAVLSLADVTDLHSVQQRLLQANAELARQRAFLETVVCQMPAGVFIAEAPSGRLLMGNDQAAHIWRHPYRQADTTAEYGQYRGFHPDGRPLQTEEWPLARAIATGEIVENVEISIVRGDGSRGVIVASASPILNELGHVAAGVATFYDITEQKELEQALRRARDELELRVQVRTVELVETNEALRDEIEVRRQAEEDLRESEIRFRQLAEHIDEMFFLLEPEGNRVLYVSPIYEALWGRPAEELYHHPAAVVRGIHPEDRRRVLAAWRSGWAEYDQEFRIVRPDGNLFWLRTRTFPIESEPGTVHRIAGVVENVTAQKEAQAALIEAERLSTAGAIAASLSHEINNPLQAAMGSLSLAQEALREQNRPEPYLDVAHSALRRTAGVVAQLRGLYGCSAEDERVRIDLNAMLKKVLNLCWKRCELQAIDVTYRPEEDLPAVYVVPNIVQQVFLNLVLNAVEAMPDGGALEIRVKSSHSPEGAWVSFADTRKRLLPDSSDRVFEPFYSAKSDGLGLGLYISRNLVKQLGGCIEVESEREKGTVFSVWLPA